MTRTRFRKFSHCLQGLSHLKTAVKPEMAAGAHHAPPRAPEVREKCGNRPRCAGKVRESPPMCGKSAGIAPKVREMCGKTAGIWAFLHWAEAQIFWNALSAKTKLFNRCLRVCGNTKLFNCNFRTRNCPNFFRDSQSFSLCRPRSCEVWSLMPSSRLPTHCAIQKQSS